MKRLFCLLLAFLLLFGTLTAAAKTSSKNDTAELTVTQLRTKMAKLVEKYPNGSYFTDDGRACTHHFNCGENCNCKEVTAEEAGTSGNRQCYGFARYVFYQLFSLPYPHYNGKADWTVSNEEETESVTAVWSYAPKSTADVKSIFSDCRLGDVIQSGEPHSMVVLSRETNGVYVYDCNSDMLTCQVKTHLVTFEKLEKDLKNYGMSLYRAINYPTDLQSEPTLKVTSLPNKPLTEDITDFSGMKLEYRDGDYISEITCDTGNSFIENNIVFKKRIFIEWCGNSFSDDAELKVNFERENSSGGTLKFAFRNAQLKIDATVYETLPAMKELTPPKKTRYVKGQKLSPDGCSMTIIEDDGSERTIPAESLTFSGFDSSTVGKCTVTATYRKFSSNFEVETIALTTAITSNIVFKIIICIFLAIVIFVLYVKLKSNYIARHKAKYRKRH